MYKTTARLMTALSLVSILTAPAAQAWRGGGGGFGRAGGFDRGGFDRGFGGGFDHAGFDRGFGGDFDRGGFGGHYGSPTFGGGFNSAGTHPIAVNHPNYGGGGFNHPNYPNHAQLPTDGGFGNLSGNRLPENGVRNSFNGNDFNRNVNVNNINAYHGGYHPYGYGGYGYHPYGAYGYHPYGAYGYHPYGGWGYGYGYNPEAMMWTYAGVASLTTLTSFLGMSALMGASNKQQPASYSNVTYNGGNVYMDGQQAGSAADFYKQSQQLAATAYNQGYQQGAANAAAAGNVAGGPAGAGTGSAETQSTPATSGSAQDAGGPWQALGTFSLTQAGQTAPSSTGMMLQLEINKDGILHGTYYNQLTMETSPVYGALDKKTQRVSWTIGTNPSTVFDAGLGDLIKQDSSVLVHYSPENTQRMALIRLQQPPPGVGAPQNAGPAGVQAPGSSQS